MSTADRVTVRREARHETNCDDRVPIFRAPAPSAQRSRPKPRDRRARRLPLGLNRRVLSRAAGARVRLKREGGDMLEEFKKFALRGNVVDLAVGIIIGAA